MKKWRNKPRDASMRIAKIYQTNANKIFDGIVLSFQQDYYQSCQIEIPESDIQPGLSYIKYFGKNNQQSIKITVIEFNRAEKYSVEYSSNQGKHLVSYELKQLSPDQVEINYYQYHQAQGIFQKWNAKLMHFLLKNSIKRKVEAQLDALVKFSETV